MNQNAVYQEDIYEEDEEEEEDKDDYGVNHRKKDKVVDNNAFNAFASFQKKSNKHIYRTVDQS
jgi:hypothetical protein